LIPTIVPDFKIPGRILDKYMRVRPKCKYTGKKGDA
jgi:hypothetical protein